MDLINHSPFDYLPIEAIQVIASFLNLFPDICVFAQVSKKFHKAVKDGGFWSDVSLQGFHDRYGKFCKEKEIRNNLSSPTNETIKTIIKVILEYHSQELRTLDISKNAIQSFNILEIQRLLLKCPKLEKLSLAEIARTKPRAKPLFNFFNDLSTHFFLNFKDSKFLPNIIPNLKVLNLSGMALLTDKDIFLIMQSCPNIENLHVACCALTGYGFMSIARDFTSFDSKDIPTQVNELPFFRSYAAAQPCNVNPSKQATNKVLKVLDISGNQKLDETVIGAVLNQCPNLQSVFMVGCNINSNRFPPTTITLIDQNLFAMQKVDSVMLESLKPFITAPNARDHCGNTLLHLACDSVGKEDVVKFLVEELHVDVNAETGPPQELWGGDDILSDWSAYIPVNPFLVEFPSTLVDYFLSFWSQQNGSGPVRFPTSTRKISPLHFAAAKGSFGIVEYLIAHGAVVDAQDSSGVTPLMTAANFAHKKATKVLLAKGGDIHKVDNNGWSCFHHAVACAQPDGTSVALLDLLLKHGSDINAVDKQGISPLLLACAKSDKELVKQLIQRGALITSHEIKNDNSKANLSFLHSVILSETKKDWIPMMAGVFGGASLPSAAPTNKELFAFLLQNQPEVLLEVNELGETPLLTACRTGSEIVVDLILDTSIGRSLLEIPDKHGWTPLHVAASLTESSLSYKPRQTFSFRDDQNNVPLFASRPTIFTVQNSPVMLFSQPVTGATTPSPSRTHNLVLDLLLKCKPNINAKNSLGQTVTKGHLSLTIKPLLIACMTNAVATPKVHGGYDHNQRQENPLDKTFNANLLLQHGADPNAADINGWSCLHAACISGNCDLVELLLDHGANANAKDTKNVTPLLALCRVASLTDSFNEPISQSPPMPGMMMRTRVDRQVTEYEKQANPDLWKSSTVAKSVLLLVEKGKAKLDVVDGIDMKSPLHLLSTQSANDSLIKYMLDNGANINATDVKNNTALHIAISNRTFNIVTLLIQRKADINVQGEKGQTPLHVALESLLNLQFKTPFSDLLARNVIPFWPEQIQPKPAVTEWIRETIQRSSITVPYPMWFGKQFHNEATTVYAPLFGMFPSSASEFWQDAHSVVCLILNNKPDINLADNRLLTPLHYIACLGVGQMSADTYSAQHNSLYLNPTDSSSQPGICKMAADCMKLVADALAMGANTNARDVNGEIPLHKLCHMCIEFIRPNITTASIQFSFGAAHPVGGTTLGLPGEICRVLLEAKANVNAKNVFGKTPFHLACEYGIASVMEEMLNKGADVNVVDEWDGNNGLLKLIRPRPNSYLLQQHELWTFVDHFLKHGVNVNLQNKFGKTALILAAELGYNDAMTVLLAAKVCNVDLCDCIGRSALHYITSEWKDYSTQRIRTADVLSLFLVHSASLELTDQFGKTPLDYASLVVREYIQTTDHKQQSTNIKLTLEDEFLLKESYAQYAQQISQSEQHRLLFFQNKQTQLQAKVNTTSKKSQTISLLEQSHLKMHKLLHALQEKIRNATNSSTNNSPVVPTPAPRLQQTTPMSFGA